MLPDYDYQGTAAPAQLAGQADLVVVGDAVEVGVTPDELWLGMRNATSVTGPHPVEDEMRLTVERSPMTGTGSGTVEGLQVLAFLHEDEQGGWRIALEGLWLACDVEDPAAPAKLEPTGDGWPAEPTMSGIAALVTDPPQLVRRGRGGR